MMTTWRSLQSSLTKKPRATAQRRPPVSKNLFKKSDDYNDDLDDDDDNDDDDGEDDGEDDDDDDDADAVDLKDSIVVMEASANVGHW